MTNEGERQDGDGVRCLRKPQEQLLLNPPQTEFWFCRAQTGPTFTITDLLVDGEQFGCARLLRRGFTQCVVAKHLQGAADVEPLVDYLTRGETFSHEVLLIKTTHVGI